MVVVVCGGGGEGGGMGDQGAKRGERAGRLRCAWVVHLCVCGGGAQLAGPSMRGGAGRACLRGRSRLPPEL